jgi:hypothetical protein
MPCHVMRLGLGRLTIYVWFEISISQQSENESVGAGVHQVFVRKRGGPGAHVTPRNRTTVPAAACKLSPMAKAFLVLDFYYKK